jgi:hypothetical protein
MFGTCVLCAAAERGSALCAFSMCDEDAAVSSVRAVELPAAQFCTVTFTFALRPALFAGS